MGKVYSILSGKGGVGKTTTTINLGSALNLLGEDVLIVDGNLSTPNIGLHFGAPIVPITLNHVLDGRADVTDAIYEYSSGIKILPSSLSIKELQKINHNRLSDITKKLRKLSEHIFLDSSAGIGKEAQTAINSGDEIILITNPEMPSVTDALKTAKLAEQYNKHIRGVIITRHQSKKTEIPIENIKDMLELPLLGIIPEDKNMQKALSLKQAIIHSHPNSKASKAYKEVAKKILGERYIQNQETKEKSWWKKIFS